eukprot:11193590-Lingulodinium_polyedra.AAC.1
MMRSSLRCAAIAAHKPHASALHARTVFRSARGVRERAVCEPPLRRNVGSTATFNRAVASTFRRRIGLQIA